MKNYTTLNENLKDETVNFIKDLSNGLNKVETHFITDVTSGILKHNSVNLSDIVRQTGKTNIKKGVERLERHLDTFNDISGTIQNNYENMVKAYINTRKIYFVDRSEITKQGNTKFENMGYVLDGSNAHKICKGYQINEISTIDNSNQPISLVSELRSANDSEYNSENELWMKHMKYVTTTYGKGTFIMDRGFDGAILMQKIIGSGSDFIIRAKSLTRNVYVNGEKTTIRNIALHHKGYYKFKSRGQNLKVYAVHIRIKTQDVKDLKQHPLTLIIVKGFTTDKNTLNEAYMALITSRVVSGKNDVIQVVKDYLLRWKIEESFKYKKQQFSLEKIMVRRYKRIQALNTLLSYVMFFSNVINLKAIGKAIRKSKIHLKKEVKFWLYRVSEGIKEIMSFLSRELMELLYPKRQPRRRDLWTVCGVAFRPY